MTSRDLFLWLGMALVWPFLCLAQEQESSSLLSFDELTYSSAYEETVLTNFILGKEVDYFSLFLCKDKFMTPELEKQFRDTFKEKIKAYKENKFENLKETKKVSRLYEQVHEDFLELYFADVPFSFIFKNGEYHCVTSTMLFAMIFDEMGIPYQIKEIPSHVYLVAYPNSSYITVETTNPTVGTITYEQGFKNNFAEYLRNAKMISKEEAAGKSQDQLFEEYFNKTETISMATLASLQYRNDALSSMKELDFNTASINMEKAWMLNKDTANYYLLYLSWVMNYTQQNKMDTACAYQLGKLSRFLGKGLTSDQIVGEFMEITNKQLLSEGDTGLYDLSYNTLMEDVKDSALRAELSFVYYAERGALLSIKMENMRGLSYLIRALQLKPNNVKAMEMLYKTLQNVLTGMEPEEAIKIMDDLWEELPSLNENITFNQLRLGTYLWMMDDAYYHHEIKTGEACMRTFETLYPERDPRYAIMDSMVERAYSTASLYYFRLGKTGRSKQIVEKGLLYVPYSNDLKSKLNALK